MRAISKMLNTSIDYWKRHAHYRKVNGGRPQSHPKIPPINPQMCYQAEAEDSALLTAEAANIQELNIKRLTNSFKVTQLWKDIFKFCCGQLNGQVGGKGGSGAWNVLPSGSRCRSQK